MLVEPMSAANLVQIIQTVVVVAGALAAFFNLKNDVSVLRNDLMHLQEIQKSMTEAFGQLNKILTEVAVQDNRLQIIERSILDLNTRCK